MAKGKYWNFTAVSETSMYLNNTELIYPQEK